LLGQDKDHFLSCYEKQDYYLCFMITILLRGEGSLCGDKKRDYCSDVGECIDHCLEQVNKSLSILGIS
jgi:hypothetical protein